jgi:hypothetical protein
VTVSVGLTSATPAVVDMFSTGPLSAYTGGSARLIGTVTGRIELPLPQGYRTSVLFTSPNVQTNQHLVANGSTGVFSNDQVTSSLDLTLKFGSDATLVIDLRPAAYSGPEAVELNAPGELTVIWN